MNLNTGVDAVPDRGLLILALVLAIPATTISMVMAVATWWGFGQEGAQVLWAAVGGLAVLGAHLLLIACRGASMGRRIVVVLLWAPCLLVVGYGHVSYFLAMQQDVGARRASAVEMEAFVDSPKRPLAAILMDAGKVRAQAASISLASCQEDCDTRKVKVALLNAKAKALDAEADDARRYQQGQDRLIAQREAAHADPVVAKFEKSLGLSETSVSLLPASLVFLILDGLACFGWYLVSQACGRSVTEPVIAPGTQAVTVAAQIDENLDPEAEVTTYEADVMRVTEAVMSGHLAKPTVDAVRAFLSCSRAKASAVARMTKARLPAGMEVA